MAIPPAWTKVWIAADPIDLVVIDLSLPGINGIELIRRIRQRWPDVRTIVVTGHTEQAYVDDAFAAGALAYVTGTYQHTGSRFTQIGDQAAGFGTVNLLSFAPNTIGGPLTATTFRVDPELPSYDIVNARIGVLRGK